VPESSIRNSRQDSRDAHEWSCRRFGHPRWGEGHVGGHGAGGEGSLGGTIGKAEAIDGSVARCHEEIRAVLK